MINCPSCNSAMVLKDSKYGKFFGCSSFPECTETHGAHPDGRPLGFPVNKEVRQLRMKAHRSLERIFGEWKTITRENRKKMYAWLKKNTKTGHIAQLDKEELLQLIIAIEEL